MTEINNNSASIPQNNQNGFSWKIDASINKKVERLWLNTGISETISVAALGKDASPSWWQRTFTHYQIRHPGTGEKVWVNFRSYEKRVGSSGDKLVQAFYKQSLSIDVYAKKVLNLKGGIPSIAQGKEGGWDALERLSKSSTEGVLLSASDTSGIAYGNRKAYLLCMDASRGDLIGKGSYKKVFKAVDAFTREDDRYVVARECPTTQGQNEAAFIRQLKNRHCIDITLSAETLSAKSWFNNFIVMPKGEPLLEKLHSLDFNQKVSVMRSLLEGLSNLHQQGVVHRDIKPGNILILKDGTPRYIDFGISQQIENLRGLIPCIAGTPKYFSPEQKIRHAGAGYNLSDPLHREELYANDVWALGVVAFDLFLQGTPTEHRNAVNTWLDRMRNNNNPERIRTAQAALDAFNLAFPPPPILP